MSWDWQLWHLAIRLLMVALGPGAGIAQHANSIMPSHKRLFSNVSAIMSNELHDSDPSELSGLPTSKSSPHATCLIAPELLNQVFWHQKTLSLTLDTVSVMITQYNNIAHRTSTNTLKGNLNELNTTIDNAFMSQAWSIAAAMAYNDGVYAETGNGFLLARGTDGQVDGVTSIPYPLPYIKVDSLIYVRLNGLSSQCSLTDLQLAPPAQIGIKTIAECTTTISTLSLVSPYYEAVSSEPFRTPSAWYTGTAFSFSDWLASNPSLAQYASCFISFAGEGLPVVKIPVEALTTTVSKTVQGTDLPTTQVAAPASPVKSVVAPSTAAAPSPTPSKPATPVSSRLARDPPDNGASMIEPVLPPMPASKLAASHILIPESSHHVASVPGPAATPKSPSKPLASTLSTLTSPHHGVSVPRPAAPLESHTVPKSASLPNNPQSGSIHNKPAQAISSLHTIAVSSMVLLEAAPTAASADHPPSIFPHAASTYAEGAIPPAIISEKPIRSGKINVVSQTPLSISKVIHYAEASSTTRDLQPLRSKTPDVMPGLHIAGSRYMSQENSGNYLIKGQILAPGRQMTMSGTPISLAADGRFAVVGTSTQHIVTAAPYIPPMSLPVIAYVGNTNSAQKTSGSTVIPDQTSKKGSQFSVTATQISYTSNAETRDVGSSTQSSAPIAPLAFTLHGTWYTMNTFGDYIVSGQTLSPGEAITMDGQTISYYSPTGGDKATGSFLSAQVSLQPHVESFTFAGATYTAGHSGNFLVGSQTLSPGSVLSISGHSIAYGTANGGYIAIQSNSGYSTPPTRDGSITSSSAVYTTNSLGDLIIHNKTLAPGEAVTVSGTPISVGLDHAQNVVVGSITQTLGPMTTQEDTFTFGDTTYTADSLGDFIIDGETLIPGQALTISGTPISYGTSNGEFVAIGSSTQSFAPVTMQKEMITFGGTTYTEDAASNFVIDGQTLNPGGVITVDGTPISYVLPQTDVVVGKSTEIVKLGSLIMGAFGNGPGAASVTSEMIITGMASATGDSTAPPLGNGAGRATAAHGSAGPVAGNRGATYREDLLAKVCGLGALLFLTLVVAI